VTTASSVSIASTTLIATPLAPMDVRSRLGRLRAALHDSSVDALLVTNLRNVRYLSGFTGSAGFLVITAHGAQLVTDGRYDTQGAAELEASGAPIDLLIAGHDQREVAVDVVIRAGVRRLALEARAVTWAEQRTYASEWFPDLELVATDGLVETLRIHKDAGEVARIERAAQIADDAFAAVRRGMLDGPSETEVAIALDAEIRRRGGSGVAFDTIVASGPNAAMPHHRPGARVLTRGDLVVVDFGAVVEGYRSDMTRTVALGEPSTEQRRLLDAVAAAQAAGVEAIGPGVAAAAVDAACRNLLRDRGLDTWFVHGTGHGVGLDIHEAPMVNARATATLTAGHVVTVEPGVYVPGLGGVRVEDTRDFPCRPSPPTISRTG
jgi:Xaa-Pro aminopeptidase